MREGAVFALSLIVLGALVGLLTVVLSHAVDGGAALFAAHPRLVWLLPVAGFCAYGIYRTLDLDFSWSTAQVMEAARDGRPVPSLLVPAIILGTAFTVLCGGSVGKEAAALQMGAGASSLLRGRVSERFRCLLAPAAMAAALGAMLSAPLAGVVFSFEALRRRPESAMALGAPVITSLVAWGVVETVDVRFLAVPVEGAGVSGSDVFRAAAANPEVIAGLLLLAIAVGGAAGLLALAFCSVLKGLRAGLARLGAPIFALAVGGVATALVVGYAELFHYEDLRIFCGTGSLQIEMALTGEAMPWWAFAAKAGLTLLTFAGGFKGGEIMPVLAIGACFGAVAGSMASGLTGANVEPLFTRAAMAAFFAACTSCPLTALVFVSELFGADVLPLAIPVTVPACLIARSVSLYPTFSKKCQAELSSSQGLSNVRWPRR